MGAIFLSLFLSILGFSLVTAAFGEYTISNELHANNILSITQTNDGHLWILAGQGVFRFDGREFETVFLEAGHPANELFSTSGRSGKSTHKDLIDSYGLSSDQIQAVIEDRKGFLVGRDEIWP